MGEDRHPGFGGEEVEVGNEDVERWWKGMERWEKRMKRAVDEEDVEVKEKGGGVETRDGERWKKRMTRRKGRVKRWKKKLSARTFKKSPTPLANGF